MKELLEKLKKIEKETSAEKGNYDLFALFLRRITWQMGYSCCCQLD